MSEYENELFEYWWENEGQYHRAGGGDYEKTFAYYAWMEVVNRDGYKLAPTEPSEEMVFIGERSHDGYDIIDAKRIYKAMIGAVE